MSSIIETSSQRRRGERRERRSSSSLRCEGGSPLSDHVRDGDIYPFLLYRPHGVSIDDYQLSFAHQTVFQGKSQIDVIKRTGFGKTCGFRAGDVVPMSPSVGVMSSFGNQAFSSFAAIMVVSPSRSALDHRSHLHTLATSVRAENICASA